MNNRRRVLAEVLAIDAWHETIVSGDNTYSSHVELSFRNGRLGGDDDTFPFTFNIALRKATLTIKLESGLAIDRKTVARHLPSTHIEATSHVTTTKRSKGSLSGGITFSPKLPSVKVAASAETEGSSFKENQTKLIEQRPLIIATPRPLGSLEYAWDLIPGHATILEGQPWNPVTEPRFNVKVLDNGRTRLEPVIKAIVSCKLEDIDITDLSLKESGPIAALKEMAFNRVNFMAAIQHLKLTLRDMNLEVGEMGDRFSSLIIADVLSAEA